MAGSDDPCGGFQLVGGVGVAVATASGGPEDVWTFADFEPGQDPRARHDPARPVAAGPVERHLRALRAGAAVPAGLLVAMMEAYIKVLQPRPPGNIHAGQRLRQRAAVRPGSLLTIDFSCLDKTVRS